MLPPFSQNLTLQEAFEITAKINEEPKITEFDAAFCKKKKKKMMLLIIVSTGD